MGDGRVAFLRFSSTMALRMFRAFCLILSRDREVVSRKAHNLEAAVRFGLPQQVNMSV